MGWNIPGQDLLEQHRDEALGAHVAFWAERGHDANNGTFFPGYEAGWHDACERLANGEGLPGDLKEYATGKVDYTENWEWIHGFMQGMQGAEDAGQTEDHHEAEPQEEEHHDEE